MVVQELEQGLWRWTAPHPAWKPGEDWERDVGCVYWEGPDAVVLVDPLVPTDPTDSDRFHRALARDLGRADLPLAILQACPFHSRSVAELAERYGASIHLRADDPDLPAGVTGFAVPAVDEVVWWLEGAAAVVPGDALLGDGRGGVAPCPADWLVAGSTDDLAAQLEPLLALPCRHVLVSHGAPVLGTGAAALRAALGR